MLCILFFILNLYALYPCFMFILFYALYLSFYVLCLFDVYSMWITVHVISLFIRTSLLLLLLLLNFIACVQH